MERRATVGRKVTLLCISLLTVWPALGVQASAYVETRLIEKIFPEHKELKVIVDHTSTSSVQSSNGGLTFRIGDCSAVAVTNESGTNVAQIFLFYGGKDKPSAKTMEKIKPVAERMHTYLQGVYPLARCAPFSDGKSGYVLDLSGSGFRVSSFLSNPVYGIISTALQDGGTCYKYENGELTMRLGGSDKDCAEMTFSLLSSRAKVISYFPARSARGRDERIIAGAAADLKEGGLKDYNAADSDHKDRFKTIRATSGVSKCLSASYQYALVNYRSRYYVGKPEEIRDYLRYAKKLGYQGEFSFPEKANPLTVFDEDIESVRRSSARQPGRDCLGANDLCDYFKSRYRRSGGNICIAPKGCRIVVPLPAGSTYSQRMDLALAHIYVRAEDGNDNRSLQFATILANAIPGNGEGDAEAMESVGQGVYRIKMSSQSRLTDAQDKEALELITTNRFLNTVACDWPDTTRRGKPMPAALEKLLKESEAAGSASEASSDGSARDKSPANKTRSSSHMSREEALNAYLEYLRKLKDAPKAK